MSRQGKNDAERATSEKLCICCFFKFSLLLEEWSVSNTMNGSTCCTQLTFYSQAFKHIQAEAWIPIYCLVLV